MTDIVEDLRLLQSGAQWACGQTAATLEQAADEIEMLRRAFLREIQWDNSCVFNGERCHPERCDCLAEMETLVRTAREALAG